MKGVVLMGGCSTRMGIDKAFLDWKGKPLYTNAVKKLLPFCSEVYLSVNALQNEQFSFVDNVVIDSTESDGPIGGIISCHRFLKDTLLFLGCDIPLVSDADVKNLAEIHKNGQGCTVYFNSIRNCYEPMLSIWDPLILDSLDVYFINGGRSLQRFLNENNTHKIPLLNEENFKNINTESDWKSILNTN